MAHLRSLALLLEVPGGEEVKVWMGPVRARGQDYISIESFLFFFELLAPAFLVEVDLKEGVTPETPASLAFPFCGACLPEICLAWKGLVLVGFCEGDRSVSDAPQCGVGTGGGGV